MSLLDKVKSLVYEGGPPAPPPKVVPRAGPALAAAPQSLPGSFEVTEHLQPVIPATDGMGEKIYQTLLAKTDIATITEFGQLQRFAEALNEFIPDKAMRYKAALKQAKAAGMNVANLMAAFDVIAQRLEQEQTAFASHIRVQTASQIQAREADGKGLETQIADLETGIRNYQNQKQELESKLDNLRASVDVERSKMSAANASFTSAFQRRRAEIAQQRAEFSAILS